ncbi:hypothetical protein [Sphaerisporangium corydalis]|uniref:Oxaloacetate decarboxylase gamma chain n=1 Tax=Sphaerisporangium corydalis TaxID=1441875 RepID=A0ABV9EFS6_9ACTN|nr:hypothetical protein [Sphaerisporangium corydalis]
MMAFIGAAYTVLAVLMLMGLALILIAVVTLICLALLASTTNPEPEYGPAAPPEGAPAPAGRYEERAVVAVRREARAAIGRTAIIRREGRPGVS